MSQMKIHIPSGLAPLRRRVAHVPGWACTFLVVQHIVRIDIDEPGRAGTHGWQVRYKRPSTFFGDVTGPRRRSPSASLANALSFLDLIYTGPKNQLRVTPTRRKKNEIQEAGIRLVVMRKPHKTFDEYYIEAMSPSKSVAAKRTYVGTGNTITLPRVEAAMHRARLLRFEMALEHLAGRKRTAPTKE